MLRVKTTTQSGATYTSPFIQNHQSPLQIPVDISAFTANELTTDGYLKPGVPIRKVAGAAGVLVSGAGQVIRGVTVELAKVADSFADRATAGNGSGVVQVAVGCEGMVSRALIEEMLGRALTANEVAAFAAADSQIILQEP